MYKERQ